MKKLLYLITITMLLCVLQGCRKHVYHTCYGDIDIDTIKAEPWDDEGPVYKIHVDGNDSILFKPYDGTYYRCFPTNDEHGNAVVQWDPETGECTSNW